MFVIVSVVVGFCVLLAMYMYHLGSRGETLSFPASFVIVMSIWPIIALFRVIRYIFRVLKSIATDCIEPVCRIITVLGVGFLIVVAISCAQALAKTYLM